jgi:hypothetical protein
VINCQLGDDRVGDHILEQDLDGHCMSAALVGDKEFTVTFVDTILKRHMVIVVITVEGQIKLIEEEALSLFRIPLCFFSFSNHSVVHVYVSFQVGIWNKKSTQIDACFSAGFFLDVGRCSHRTVTSMTSSIALFQGLVNTQVPIIDKS